MINRKFLFLILSFVIVSMPACEKKKAIRPINESLRKHFSFKEGSYWVYKDLISGDIDSFSVTRNYLVQESDLHGPYYQERISIACFKNSTYDSILLFRWKLQDNLAHVTFFDIPVFAFRFDNTFQSDVPVTKIFDSYSVAGRTYKSSAEMCASERSKGYFDDTAIVSIDAGLIEFSILFPDDTLNAKYFPLLKAFKHKFILQKFNVLY